MFSDNLIQLRKAHRMTQEAVAEKVGVSRLAVAKWEAGDSMPDLETGQKLAQLFGVSLDMLVSFESEANMNLYAPPKGKHLFGIVSVGDKGQIIIPARARKIFDISPGDQLVILGDEGSGLAIMKASGFLDLANAIRMQMPGNADGE